MRSERGAVVKLLAGVLAAALVGTAAVFAVFETINPLADWVVVVGSSPFERCGFAIPPVPSQASCLAGLFGELAGRIVLALVIVGLPVWAALRSRRASVVKLVLAWSAAGFLVETARLTWRMAREMFTEPPLPAVAAHPLWELMVWVDAERLAVFAGLVAAVMAVVFWAIAGTRQPRPGQGLAAAK